MSPPPQITIVMPALNEEANVAAAIRSTLGAFDAHDISGEVLVVNDGSTDGTEAVIQQEMQQDARVRTIRHETPQGIGGAFWDGVDHAHGTFVCMCPGDNENDPNEILRYLPLLDHVDMVVPFVFNKQVRSRFRKLISFAYGKIVNLTFGVSFHYTNGTVIYRKQLLAALPVRNSSFFFQTDILIRCARRGYLFAEVPYQLKQRTTGRSAAVSLRSLLSLSRAYLRLVCDVYFRRTSDRKGDFAPETQTARRWARCLATSTTVQESLEEEHPILQG